MYYAYIQTRVHLNDFTKAIKELNWHPMMIVRTGLTWFCTVIVNRCLCNSTIFVSSNMAAIFFESMFFKRGMRVGELRTPSKYPSLLPLPSVVAILLLLLISLWLLSWLSTTGVKYVLEVVLFMNCDVDDDEFEAPIDAAISDDSFRDICGRRCCLVSEVLKRKTF